MDQLRNIRLTPAKETVVTFSSVRRRLLKTIGAIAVAPLWTMACDRPAIEGRQGDTQMRTSKNQVANGPAAGDLSIPVIDTHIPDIIHTATFAMG